MPVSPRPFARCQSAAANALRTQCNAPCLRPPFGVTRRSFWQQPAAGALCYKATPLWPPSAGPASYGSFMHGVRAGGKRRFLGRSQRGRCVCCKVAPLPSATARRADRYSIARVGRRQLQGSGAHRAQLLHRGEDALVVGEQQVRRVAGVPEPYVCMCSLIVEQCGVPSDASHRLARVGTSSTAYE